MKVNNYKVFWRHNNYAGQSTSKMDRRVKIPDSYTECIIKDKEDEILWEGVTVLGKKDIYNKKVGRKLSFERAVQKIDSRELRKKFWEEFKNLSSKCLNCH